MKAVILAGGFGTRLAEETVSIPKPMVEIAGKPILWHIMKIYSSHGINDFIICLGYKSYVVKEFFSNFVLHNSDVKFDMTNGSIEYLNSSIEPWRVTLVDTGLETMTGGRLTKIRHLLNGETFCMTYGDGLSDVDISKVIEFHKSHGKLVTVTATPSPGRFGALEIDSGQVSSFEEKVQSKNYMINAGFFVMNPAALDFVRDDTDHWERYQMEMLVQEKQLMAYEHTGLWQPMDTLREKQVLEEMWHSGNAAWKVW